MMPLVSVHHQQPAHRPPLLLLAVPECCGSSRTPAELARRRPLRGPGRAATVPTAQRLVASYNNLFHPHNQLPAAFP